MIACPNIIVEIDGIPLELLSKAAAVVGGASLVAMGGAVLLPAAIIGGLNVIGFGVGGVIGGKSLQYLALRCCRYSDRITRRLNPIGCLWRPDRRLVLSLSIHSSYDIFTSSRSDHFRCWGYRCWDGTDWGCYGFR